MLSVTAKDVSISAKPTKPVNARVKAALEAGLKVILCIGELEKERDQGITAEILGKQTKVDLLGVTAEQMKNVIIAYEPVWAIGTGKTATTAQADEACGVVRNVVAELYGKAVAEETIVQYGGSMNAKNAAELLACRKCGWRPYRRCFVKSTRFRCHH